ncbi:MAG: alpha-glucosidase [Lachnospiraceae bacterium]|nr:alpha-glucosidase [Lachnospiraceae bacterium]
MLTLDSTIGELYRSPIGHDLADRILLQLGLPQSTLTNPLVSHMKIRSASKLVPGKLDPALFDAILNLVNREPENVPASAAPVKPAWWKEAVFYQIYPRSFCDSNGDGIGDIPGILSRLDYLKDLGVDALWLSPVYDSPNDDNGYDIRDYRAIMKEFGTMEDFDRLLAEVHARGMRLIMDLVINHTSDEHPWFQEALADPASPRRGYYFLRPGTPDALPNNWGSFFSGPAWRYFPEQQLWGLHLFSKKQMDLNWENDALRQEVLEMIRWWLEKGVDGFRMDVINYISKDPGLPDGDPTVTELIGISGMEHYVYGPRLHEFLQQIRREAFEPYGAFSVGEGPGLGMNMSRMVTAEERRELDMVFSFDHLETPGHGRLEDYEYDLNYYRDHILQWIRGYGNNCRIALFFNNHDNPRMVSKVSRDRSLHPHIAKLLAVLQLTLPGTPFIYQGDEMGLSNYHFTNLDQITDVEAKGFVAENRGKRSDADLLHVLNAGSREHARILLPGGGQLPPWHAGVTQQTPDKDVEESYRFLLKLRRESKVFPYGTFELISDKKNAFVYRRTLNGKSYVIECNLAAEPRKPLYKSKKARLIFDSQPLHTGELGPYHAQIWEE